MEFEMEPEVDGELGARVEDVAQEAIDATATTYTNDAGIDVDEFLRVQLSSRGIRAVNEEWLAETAHQIRSGHEIRVGEPDGSVDGS
jgi:hypothetical protein